MIRRNKSFCVCDACLGKLPALTLALALSLTSLGFVDDIIIAASLILSWNQFKTAIFMCETPKKRMSQTPNDQFAL